MALTVLGATVLVLVLWKWPELRRSDYMSDGWMKEHIYRVGKEAGRKWHDSH